MLYFFHCVPHALPAVPTTTMTRLCRLRAAAPVNHPSASSVAAPAAADAAGAAAAAAAAAAAPSVVHEHHHNSKLSAERSQVKMCMIEVIAGRKAVCIAAAYPPCKAIHNTPSSSKQALPIGPHFSA